jgi:hypothetical protein
MTFEGGLTLRTVVIEFESVAAATAAYNEPAYQACLRILSDAAERDIRSSKVSTDVEGEANTPSVPDRSPRSAHDLGDGQCNTVLRHARLVRGTGRRCHFLP